MTHNVIEDIVHSTPVWVSYIGSFRGLDFTCGQSSITLALILWL